MSARLVSQWMLGSSELPPEEFQAPPSVRAQSAVVRTLAHALQQLSPTSDVAAALRQQLAEELGRLGTRIEEAAAMRREQA
jgi:hypothetical protein